MANQKTTTKTTKATVNASPVTGNNSFVVNAAQVNIPKFELNKIKFSQNDWINYGDNNDFPDFLISSVKKSENHSAFIHLRENMIKGGGLSYNDKLKPFFENLDEDGTTIEDLWSDLAGDMANLETFAIAVRYNKTKTAIISLDYIDSSKVRPSKVYEVDKKGEPTDKISGYFICPDWQLWRTYTPVFYQRFNPNNIDDTTQLFFYHKRVNGQPWLPEVSFASCLNYVEMEDHLSKFGLNSMLNGFFGSAIMTVVGSMSEEQKRDFQSSVRSTFTGSDNASKLMVVVTEAKDSVKVEPLTTGDQTPMLAALSAKSQQAIATAHRCNAALAAVSSNTGFSSEAALLRSAQEQFQNNVIIHLQKPIISFFKKIAIFNKIDEFDLKINSINLVAEITPDWFLTDYIRPEVLAAKYGFKKEDLIDTLVPPEVPVAVSVNPYPTNVIK